MMRYAGALALLVVLGHARGGCPTEQIGDTNDDGSIDLLDVEPFIQMLVGGIPAECSADVNEDGAINLLDVAPLEDILWDNQQ